MKFCHNCGTKLNDGDLFCYNCGTKCVSVDAPKEEPKEEPKPEPIIPPSQDPSLEEKRKEEEAKRLKEEEAKKAALEEAKRKEEEEARLVEEAKRKAEEEARLAEERRLKEERLNEIEVKRAEKKYEKDAILEEDALLREEENKLRKELDLPVKEEPVEEVKVVKEVTPGKAKPFLVEEDEFNSPTLLKHSVIFFAILLGISLIYWLIGSLTGIPVAVRIILFFVALGLDVLPIIELVKLIIYMIKNKKINLFVVILLGVIQILMWVFISLNFSAMF